ncbi:MAG: hypothetical protein MJE68_07690 [Proteobacteria bacterium]|nr:hypothetical protein [Pseudomonadota bacterium]
MHAYDGGAIWLSDGSLIIDSEVSLMFSHNSAGTSGGAILLQNGKLVATTNANLNFSNNSGIYGGGLLLRKLIVQVDTDGILFYNNKGSNGGALYFNSGIMYINANKSVKFIMNIAQDKGGAIFIERVSIPLLLLIIFPDYSFCISRRCSLYHALLFHNHSWISVEYSVYKQCSIRCWWSSIFSVCITLYIHDH